MLTIREKTVWETSDGRIHQSPAVAEEHVLKAELIEVLRDQNFDEDGAHDILHALSASRETLRVWLNAVDKMEQRK